MADNKNSRDNQADDADRRQRERDLAEELERMGESEPAIDAEDLSDIVRQFDTVKFPVTGTEIVDEVGEEVVESSDGAYSIEELVPETDEVVFESPSAVRERVQRPKIAAAMKRIVEASAAVPHTEFGESQRNAYKKTLHELKSIDADDDDEGVQAITDWIVDQIHEKEKLPGSRAVRRQAAEFCRENGYSVRNDEWLGV